MCFTKHVVLGGIASIGFYLLWGPAAIYFWAGSVLIDIDHYTDYLYHNKFKDFSVRRMFDYHNLISSGMDRRPGFLNVSPLHTVEFLFPLYLCAHWTDSLAVKATVFGCLFHMCLDFISLYKKKIFFNRTFTVVEYIIRKRLLLRRGLNPTHIYIEAATIVRNQNGN